MKSKLLSTLIIVIVASGTAIIPFLGETPTGTEPLKALFFAFVSAIIAIQLVPAIILLGSLIKNAVANHEKKQES